MTEALSYASKLSIGGTAVEYVSCDLKESRELIDDEDGMRGTRSRTLERAVQGQIKCGGSIKMNPTPAELALVLPFATQSSAGTTLTDALQDFAIIHDLQTKAYTYTNSRISKFTLVGQQGKKIDMDLQIVAKARTEGSGGSVSGVPDITVRPYMMQDMGSGVTIGGTAYSVDEFEFSIDNKIEPTFMQGQTATDLEPTDREVRLKIRLKYTSTEQALLGTAITGPVLGSPVTGSVAFTNGTNSVTLTFGALIAMPESVTATKRQDKLRLPLEFHCLKVGTTLEVVPVLV